jgi:NADH/NAD ratio-sensing transcriptional regulator Rex
MYDLQDVSQRTQALTAVMDRSRAVASSRKLVRDIELTMKKVSDGISLFNEFGEKMEAAEVCNQQSILPSSRQATCETRSLNILADILHHLT